jgi:hypothetical protein
MIEAQNMAYSASEGRETVQAALKRCDSSLSKSSSILGYLLSTREQSLFSDEIVARVRGMLTNIASQILRVQAEATGKKGADQFALDNSEALTLHLAEEPVLLSHCHSIALEWQFALRLEALYAVDPVLTPMMQDLIESENSSLASAAMALLASQARFSQLQRRMELPLAELPGDQFHACLAAWRSFNRNRQSDALTRAESKLRDSYDEGAGRIALLDRVITALGAAAPNGLEVEKSGAALFITSLAAILREPREEIALCVNEEQIGRLMLSLRAAGMKSEACEAIALRIHPEAHLPAGLEAIGTREAAQMLSQSTLRGAR